MAKDIIPLIELQYFPSIEYFVLLLNSEKILIESSEYYEKQSYRNRCYVLGSNKIQHLTVPVLNGNSKVIVKDIRIDYSQKWLGIHWKTITSAYGKSPFFMFYGDYIEEVLFKKHKYLFDLNLDLLKVLMELAGVKKEVEFTNEYKVKWDERIKDCRSLIHPKKDKKINGIYRLYQYKQLFGREFVENLSILDLLFCEGNNTLNILRNSSGKGVTETEELV